MVTGQKDIKLVRVSGGSNMGQAKWKVISKIENGGGRTLIYASNFFSNFIQAQNLSDTKCFLPMSPHLTPDKKNYIEFNQTNGIGIGV